MRTGFGVLAFWLSIGTALAADGVLMGQAAFGDWRTDAPGVRRLITPADLPSPFATASVGNPPRRAPRTPAVVPKAPPGFAVDLFAAGLSDAPRGTHGAQRRPLRRGERRGPDPRVSPRGRQCAAAERRLRRRPCRGHSASPSIRQARTRIGSMSRLRAKCVRFAYRRGDMKAEGPAETVVRDLPSGGAHWTRDIAFSPDNTTMFVSVGSATNDDGTASEGTAQLAGVRRDGAGPRRRARLRSRRKEHARRSRPASATVRASQSSRRAGRCGARSTSATGSATTCRPTMRRR